jgi:hypothetical protein
MDVLVEVSAMLPCISALPSNAKRSQAKSSLDPGIRRDDGFGIHLVAPKMDR